MDPITIVILPVPPADASVMVDSGDTPWQPNSRDLPSNWQTPDP
jgi:hypothetical protein